MLWKIQGKHLCQFQSDAGHAATPSGIVYETKTACVYRKEY